MKTYFITGRKPSAVQLRFVICVPQLLYNQGMFYPSLFFLFFLSFSFSLFYFSSIIPLFYITFSKPLHSFYLKHRMLVAKLLYNKGTDECMYVRPLVLLTYVPVSWTYASLSYYRYACSVRQSLQILDYLYSIHSRLLMI